MLSAFLLGFKAEHLGKSLKIGMEEENNFFKGPTKIFSRANRGVDI